LGGGGPVPDSVGRFSDFKRTSGTGFNFIFEIWKNRLFWFQDFKKFDRTVGPVLDSILHN